MRPVCIPDQGFNQKQSTLDEASHKTAHNTQPMRQKYTCFMLNLTKHETNHAHKYPNINNYWHSYTYFHDGAQRQKHHIF